MSGALPVIGIAGSPGARKSRLAAALASRLPGVAVVAWDSQETFTRQPPEAVAAWLQAGAPISAVEAPGPAARLARAAARGPVVFEAPFGRRHPQTGRLIDRLVRLDAPADVALARKLAKLVAAAGCSGSRPRSSPVWRLASVSCARPSPSSTTASGPAPICACHPRARPRTLRRSCSSCCGAAFASETPPTRRPGLIRKPKLSLEINGNSNRNRGPLDHWRVNPLLSGATLSGVDPASLRLIASAGAGVRPEAKSCPARSCPSCLASLPVLRATAEAELPTGGASPPS